MRDLGFVTEPGEVVSRPATRTPHPTRTGGQDDSSYTNSLKLSLCDVNASNRSQLRSSAFAKKSSMAASKERSEQGTARAMPRICVRAIPLKGHESRRGAHRQNTCTQQSNKQSAKQTNTHTNTNTPIHTHRQTNKHTNNQTKQHTRTHTQTNTQTNK